MSAQIMTPGRAKKRYMSRMIGSGLAYMASVFGISFLVDEGDPVTIVTIGLALIPGAFILMMLWSVWNYLSDVDEVARHDYTQAMMISLFGVLAISGGWGLVELYNDAMPRLPVFFIFPFFFLFYGLVSCFRFGRGA